MNRRLTRTPGLAEVVREDRAVVLNLPQLEEQQSPYVFEGPAFEIWRRIDGSRSQRLIVSELAAAFEVDEDVMEQDVRGFVATIAELGLIDYGQPDA
ncbi:PqqD family protein [Demequina activiva]|uniref:Coenzyme PQQ synthesis protein D (PqqD) n=1 Tax=Demequina activiva TaxID=1582364 RepID=A0A919UFK2_9MICO|nr:PqqD family protein [Demequina activiva]GIG53772.1 hypothetical protein Dac01nite_05240 [Demequina activiva]